MKYNERLDVMEILTGKNYSPCEHCLQKRNKCPALQAGSKNPDPGEVRRREIVCEQNFLSETLIDESDYNAE